MWNLIVIEETNVSAQSLSDVTSLSWGVAHHKRMDGSKQSWFRSIRSADRLELRGKPARNDCRVLMDSSAVCSQPNTVKPEATHERSYEAVGV